MSAVQAAEQLLQSLHDRVRAYTTLGDPSTLLDNACAHEAEELERIGQLSSPEAVPPPLAAILAAVHWYRYELLPHDQTSLTEAMQHLWHAARWALILTQMHGSAGNPRIEEVLSFQLTAEEGVNAWLDAEGLNTSLISQVRDAIGAHLVDARPAAIIDDVALLTLNEVIAEAERSGRSLMAVVQLVAWFHWCRLKLERDAITRLVHLKHAIDSFSALARVDAELLPIQLRPLIMRDPAYGEGPHWWAEHALAILQRADEAADPEAVDHAIGLLRRVLATLPADNHDRIANLGRLAGALRLRGERTGSVTDLHEAVSLENEAVERQRTVPDGGANLALLLSNRGGTFRARYDCTGESTDLDRAIADAREAVSLAPAGAKNRPRYINNLATSLQARFEISGSLADLDVAIAHHREAIGYEAEGTARLGMALSMLGAALRNRYQRTGHLPDLREAVEVTRQAVELVPAGHRTRHLALVRFATTMHVLFGHSAEIADLEEAISTFRMAAAMGEAGPEQATTLAKLGRALTDRFLTTGDRAAIAEAVEALRHALSVADRNHPNRSSHLGYLADALIAAMPSKGGERQQNEIEEVLALLLEATNHPTTPLDNRVFAAQALGRAAAMLNRPVDGRALAAFRRAIELLPRLVWHGIDRRSGEVSLHRLSSLATDAAAAALAQRQQRLAVALLEQGRSVLWGQQLDTRTDLSHLREIAPGLAESLSRINSQLNTPPHQTPSSGRYPAGDEAVWS